MQNISKDEYQEIIKDQKEYILELERRISVLTLQKIMLKKTVKGLSK